MLVARRRIGRICDVAQENCDPCTQGVGGRTRPGVGGAGFNVEIAPPALEGPANFDDMEPLLVLAILALIGVIHRLLDDRPPPSGGDRR
jgi:hypothetical protein